MKTHRHIMHKAVIGSLLLLLLYLLVSAVRLKSVSEVALFHIEVVSGPSEELITSLDIRESLLARFPKIGHPGSLADLDLYELEQWIQNMSAIASADAYVDASGRLMIKAKQRTPVLRVFSDAGFNGYLDEFGLCFTTPNHAVARLPVLTGRVDKLCNVHADYANHTKELAALARMISRDELLDGLIEQIHVQDIANIYLIPKIGKHKVLLGGMDRIEDKLINLTVFYREGLTRKGFRSYSLIDLRFEGQVVCKKS